MGGGETVKLVLLAYRGWMDEYSEWKEAKGNETETHWDTIAFFLCPLPALLMLHLFNTLLTVSL